MDYTTLSGLKTRKQKWLETTVILAGILFLLIILVSISYDKEADEASPDSNKKISLWSLLKYLIVVAIGIVMGMILSRKSNERVLSDNEIVNHVADEEYKNRGIYLSTKMYNVKTERGLQNETYVEFFDEAITFLFEDGIGIRERSPGQSIKDIKTVKQHDIVEMKRAEIGIRDEKDTKMMDAHDRINEPQ